MSQFECVLVSLLVLVTATHVKCALNIRGGASGLLQGGLFGNNLNNNNNNNNLNNRIRDTFMVGILNGKNSACNGTGSLSATAGVCKPQKECTREGGTPSGVCSLVGSCCILDRSCGATTNDKVSYFTYNDLTNQIQTMCTLSIRPFSSTVCQIRLDFERFMIAGPNVETEMCDVDGFSVAGGMGNLGFVSICGINDGQHIYIPVDSTLGGNAMLNNYILQFMLQANRTGLAIQNPNWRIKITQLECDPFVKNFTSIQSTLTSMYQKHQNKQSNVNNDRQLIAPPGCLQYYPAATGRYESFNYNNGNGPMPANTNYAICFRRTPGVCGVQHTADTFLMANDLGGSVCQSPTQDYLYIPESSDGVILTSDYYCEQTLDGQVVRSNSRGPQYVVVRTDGEGNTGDFANAGFRIAYQTTTCANNLL